MSNYNNSARSVDFVSEVDFLKLPILPARLSARQTSWLIGCQENHIPILVMNGLLKPLGKPPHNAPKFFGRDTVLRLARDERWLVRISDSLVSHWANKNKKYKSRLSQHVAIEGGGK